MNNDDSQNDQTQSNSNSSDVKTGQEKLLNPSRRKFLKIGIAGAGATAAAIGGITAVNRMEGIPQKEFPVPTNEKFRLFKQKNTVLTQAAGGLIVSWKRNGMPIKINLPATHLALHS